MTAKELVDELETKYRWGDGTVEPRPPDASRWTSCEGGRGSRARALFHTRYHDRGGGGGGGGRGGRGGGAAERLVAARFHNFTSP